MHIAVSRVGDRSDGHEEGNDVGIENSDAGHSLAGSVAGLVLAAGAGSRYGKPKVLAEGGSWLERSVTALHDGGCRPVFVALGAALVELPEPAVPIEVSRWELGIGETISTCIAHLANTPDIDGVVIHLVDIPDVSVVQVARVLQTAQGSRMRAARACFGGRPGHPVYLGAGLFDRAIAGVTGDRGLGGFLSRLPDLKLVECGDVGTGVDWDIPRPLR
ncbi:NTP transferase domain-containing protein [Gordonia westfalica]|uniref:NTP transferase domain-containing protein n=1 Tax=Gordonia westfalica TaxID=158898 RepID=A0ABU2GZ50_9ACTN|nr:NTP transferase domain-containing protein [Gordonia westfalica]MDS1116743.1 NTP transferase domain-containing protein [Gordonia westfalica]